MLYIIATPIGSIEELSFQAIKALAASDTILAEDTRSFTNLYKRALTMFNVKPSPKQAIISYYKDVEAGKLPLILGRLKGGKTISLVTESGSPLVSDPGFMLVKSVIRGGLEYTSIPGPCAFVNAAILCGCSFKQLLFMGYLPKNKSRAIKTLKKARSAAENFKSLDVVLYESPHRIFSSLKLISTVLDNPEMCICCQMNKRHELVLRGTAETLCKKNIRGEITIILHI